MTDWQTFAQMYFNGAYQNNTALVLTDPAVSISRGVADDLDLKPGACSFRLLDDADRYRPSNVASDLYGQTGAYMRGAYATGGVVLFTGEAQAMTPGQTDYVAVSGGLVVRGVKYVDVRLGGPLARVGRWRDEVAPPLNTQINGYANLRGHFPLDDGRIAIAPRNLYPPGRPGTAAAVSFASFDGPGSGAQVVKVSNGGVIGGSFAPMSTSAGWQIAWSANIQSATASGVETFTVNTTSGYVWRWSVATGSYTLTVDKPDGTNALTSVIGSGTGAGPGGWITTQWTVTQSGGTVSVDSFWYPEAGDVFYGSTDTFAGTMGAPTNWRVPGNTTTDDSGFCNVFALTSTADNLVSSDYVDAFNGYVREHAADRFTRLCTSRGLAYVLRGTASRSARMGPQPLKTINDLFKEIRQTEGGLIFDRGDNIGVVLATRDYLYTQAATPALALTYPTQVSGLAEITDARDVYNQVTATSTDGQSFTVSEPNGKLGTTNPPTGAGLVDLKIDVNVWDPGVLEDIATWWLRYYTNEGPRFDSIVIDLDDQPSLLTAVNALEPGMFVTVTGRTPDPLLLMITGLNRSTHRSRNVCSLEVVDGRVFDVAVYDDAGSRYDSATTTVASPGISAAATTLPVTTTNVRDCWSTTSVPYALVVLGERVTCTAASAPAGSGPYTQNLTITRGVNGFSKALTTGARVGLADPVRRG